MKGLDQQPSAKALSKHGNRCCIKSAMTGTYHTEAHVLLIVTSDCMEMSSVATHEVPNDADCKSKPATTPSSQQQVCEHVDSPVATSRRASHAGQKGQAEPALIQEQMAERLEEAG